MSWTTTPSTPSRKTRDSAPDETLDIDVDALIENREVGGGEIAETATLTPVNTPTTTASPTATPPSKFDPYVLDWDNPPVPQSLAGPYDHPLPAKFTEFRLAQWRGIVEIVEALDDGVKVVIVDAPTGAGKSLIGAAVPQILGKPFVYCGTTKSLQEQIAREFPYAKVLKGKTNYPTVDTPDMTADDCDMERKTLPACPTCPGYENTWGGGAGGGVGSGVGGTGKQKQGRHCSHCHPVSNCPYRVAKQEAASARMSVLNIAYFLSSTNHLKEMSPFVGRDIVVIDEADTLEKELMGFVTVEITAAMRKQLKVGVPDKKTVSSSWVEWLEGEVLPALNRLTAQVKSNLAASKNTLFGKPDVKLQRRLNSLKRLRQDILRVLEPAGGGEEAENTGGVTLETGWVMSGLKEGRGGGGGDWNDKATITFKPITVKDYAKDYLWSHGKQFVLMSATPISAEQMAYDLGLEDDEWRSVVVPSSFPKTSRPILLKGEVSVTRKTYDETWPVVLGQMVELVDHHSDVKVLVHSNSYQLTRDLFYEGRRKAADGFNRFVMYENAQGREAALKRYLQGSNSVLIAPSFERGIDLPGDDCRVQIIAKVMYPSLGDEQVSARLYGTGKWGKSWYATETIRSIVQATGRGMRFEGDACVTYILDRQFLRLWSDNLRLFPEWWREAVVFDVYDPKWKASLAALDVKV